MRNFDRRLLPGNHSKRILIDFVTKWYQQNAVFQIRDGKPAPEPLPLAADGQTPQIRDGSRSLIVRDSWGANDPADIKRKIVVSLGAYRKTRRHIGNFQGPIQIADSGGVIHGGEVYTASSPYPVEAMCCSSNAAEAHDIAQIVAEALDFCRAPMRAQYKGLLDVGDPQVGRPVLIDQPTAKTQLVGVQVGVVFEVQYDWIIYDVSGSTLRSFLQQVATDEDFVQQEVGGLVSF